MISSDPRFRTERLEALREALVDLKAGDRDLPAAFVDAVFPELPDGFVLSEPSELAGWIADAYDFVVHTVPPAFQVYRGAPGLHVRVRNPDDEDVTVVDTHTPHVPFIFESLKNYFQQQGLRVISAIHPLFTVQRQWERIVRIGDAGGEGARELYCQFRIERLESRERLRRIEHQVHAVLKSVFLAVEDFPAMRRAIQETGMRLRGRDGVPGDPGAGGRFSTGSSTTTSFCSARSTTRSTRKAELESDLEHRPRRVPRRQPAPGGLSGTDGPAGVVRRPGGGRWRGSSTSTTARAPRRSIISSRSMSSPSANGRRRAPGLSGAR